MTSVQHLAHIELLTPQATPKPFGELWAQRPVVVTFLRQFGCIFCHQAAAEILDARQEIAKHADIAFIGNGNPTHAGEFAHRLGLAGGVYTDPARLLYDGLGLHHGVRRTVNLASRRLFREAESLGFRQVDVRGHRWQLGGSALIDQKGDVRFVFRSERAGEHVDIRTLLNELSAV